MQVKKRKKWSHTSPQEAEVILHAYANGVCLEKAVALCGRSQTAGFNILRKQGFKPRGHSENNRKYAVNETFFDCIDTEAKAYWLGFLTADGSLSPDHTLRVQLQRKDEAHLRKLKDALQSEHRVRRGVGKTLGKEHPHSRISICSKRLSLALHKLGALSYGQPAGLCEYIPAHLQKHYWRGFVDGDGTISSRIPPKRHFSTWEIGLCGSHEIVQAFADFILERLGHFHKVYPVGKIFAVYYHGLPLPRSIAKLLYADAYIFLDRKKKQADQLMGIKDRRPDYFLLNGQYLYSLHSKYGTWAAVAKFLAVPKSTIQAIAHKWRQKNT